MAALEAAIFAVAGAADFRGAVLRAANLGDDADTTAAKDDPARTRKKVELLLDAGVRTFVDLTEADEGLAPYHQVVHAAGEARGLDLRHQRFPIVDQSVLPDDADHDPILDAIRRETERGVVYVHCWGGVGRTGIVIGCLLVDHGYHAQAALDRLGELRAATRKARRAAPENAEQEAVIRRRATRAGT